MWDTAGAMKFRNITNLYYRDAKIVMIVFDITNKSSFEDLRDNILKEVKVHS